MCNPAKYTKKKRGVFNFRIQEVQRKGQEKISVTYVRAFKDFHQNFKTARIVDWNYKVHEPTEGANRILHKELWNMRFSTILESSKKYSDILKKQTPKQFFEILDQTAMELGFEHLVMECAAELEYLPKTIDVYAKAFNVFCPIYVALRKKGYTIADLVS